MTTTKKHTKLHRGTLKPLVATALAVGGVFNMVGIVLAEGTAAGTRITNTATATYQDPEQTPLTTTSNTVVVEVAEVAGVTVVNTDVRDINGNIAEPGDDIEYTFTITNVGNDETDISLPSAASFTGPVDSIVSIIATLPDGSTVDLLAGGRKDIQDIAPDEAITVKVIVKTSASGQVGDIVTVKYGDTDGDGQNQPYDGSGGSVFSTDNPPGQGTPGVEAGDQPPVNGEREASASGKITLGEVPLLQPLVKLSKNVGGVDNQANTNPLDDEITYDLSFSVLDDAAVPTGSNATATDLEAITITVDNASAKHILVSDAIPVGTSLSTATTTATGWVPVYSPTATTTNALAAKWYTTQAAAEAVGPLTRVGFISPAQTGANDATIAKGTTLTGFQIKVVADQVNTSITPVTVANIAQVFGSGQEEDPLTPGDETLKFPVMDESGDTTPSNYDPTTDTYSNFNPAIVDNPTTPLPEGFTPDDGLVKDSSDLATTGVDPGGTTPNDPTDDNTGDSDDDSGEAIVVTLVPEVLSSLLNGPEAAPNAIGPTGRNDDFTNKSAPLSGGNPPSVAFTNTIDNDATVDGFVTLKPVAPSDPTALPNGTKATIISADGSKTIFVYDQPTGAWTIDPASPSPSAPVIPVRKDNDDPTGDPNGTNPDNFNSGTDQFNYGVEIDLPNDPAIKDLASFPVTIQADFRPVNGPVDDSTTPNVDESITASNKTINRIYTGFLELLKTAQVLRGDGPAVSGNPAPGNDIRYRIQYRNVSEPETGAMRGNVTLDALNVKILEDGTLDKSDATAGNDNNWALDNDTNSEIDTSHVLNSVSLTNVDAGSTASVKFFNGDYSATFNADSATPSAEQAGTTVSTDVTRYQFSINGPVMPQESGFVEFDRRIN